MEKLMRDGKAKIPEDVLNETSFLLPKIMEEDEDRIREQRGVVFLIPQRYVLGLMGFLAIVNAYTMRICLSVAITEMVLPIEKENSTEFSESECPSDMNTMLGFNRTNHGGKFPWDSNEQGLILSSFYWGYIITHLPGGIIAEKFGGKHSLGLGILCTAIFTCITPFVIHATNGNWVAVVVLRILEGLGEGTTFPALNVLLAKWVPLRERAKIGTLVYAGSQIGTVAGNAISGALIYSTNDWATVFYLFGIIGILWFIIWTLICYNEPSSHPFISDKEKAYLNKEITNISNEKQSIPWRQILSSVPLWALVCAQIGHDWGFFTMVTDLPLYMKEVLKYNVKDNGYLSSIPYVIMWIVSMSSGWLCDWLIHKKGVKVATARKVFSAIASVGPAVFIIAASYSGCDRTMSVIMFTIAMGFMGTFYCGMKVNALDLSPNFAGTLMAIVNGIGAITGIIVPYLASAMTKNHTLLEWRTVFWIAFAVFLITSLIFTIFGSGDVQVWNNNVSSKNRENVEKFSNKTESTNGTEVYRKNEKLAT